MLPVKKIHFSNSSLCIQNENGFEVELDRDRGTRGFLYLYRDCSMGTGVTRLAAIIDLEDKGDVFLIEELENDEKTEPKKNESQLVKPMCGCYKVIDGIRSITGLDGHLHIKSDTYMKSKSSTIRINRGRTDESGTINCELVSGDEPNNGDLFVECVYVQLTK